MVNEYKMKILISLSAAIIIIDKTNYLGLLVISKLPIFEVEFTYNHN